MDGYVLAQDQMALLPAIATCLSDAFDGSVIGVFSHEGDSEQKTSHALECERLV